MLNTLHDYTLNNNLRKFWEIKEVPETNTISPDDLLCEHNFVETHSRDSSGRYSVSLPFKGSEPLFGDSKSNALHRFYSLERRLLKENSLYIAYAEFMKDYLQSGYI